MKALWLLCVVATTLVGCAPRSTFPIRTDPVTKVRTITGVMGSQNVGEVISKCVIGETTTTALGMWWRAEERKEKNVADLDPPFHLIRGGVYQAAGYSNEDYRVVWYDGYGGEHTVVVLSFVNSILKSTYYPAR